MFDFVGDFDCVGGSRWCGVVGLVISEFGGVVVGSGD